MKVDMRINRVNSTYFTGNIIDSHMHVGNWVDNAQIYNYTNDIDVFIKQPLKNGDNVEKIIVSNLDCMQKNLKSDKIEFLADELKGNEDLLKLAKDNKKIIPIAVCQPGYGSVQNIKTLYKRYPNKFYGLKFHPECLNISADSNLYNPYLEFAQKKKIPCLFHSGRTFECIYPNGYLEGSAKYSQPEMIYSLAKRYKNVPVIMAHMGGNDFKNSQIAVDKIINSIKNNDAKLYADISWVDCNNSAKPAIIDAIKRLKQEKGGIDRLLFGSDAPLGRFSSQGENGVSSYNAYSQNVEDIKVAIKKEFGSEADEIIEKIFYKNSEALFLTKNTKISKSKVGKFILAGLSVIAFAVLTSLYLKNFKTDSTSKR